MVLLIVVFFETRFLPRRVSYCDVSPMLLVFMNVDKYKLGRSRFYMPSSLDGDRGYSHQRWGWKYVFVFCNFKTWNSNGISMYLRGTYCYLHHDDVCTICTITEPPETWVELVLRKINILRVGDASWWSMIILPITRGTFLIRRKKIQYHNCFFILHNCTGCSNFKQVVYYQINCRANCSCKIFLVLHRKIGIF